MARVYRWPLHSRWPAAVYTGHPLGNGQRDLSSCIDIVCSSSEDALLFAVGSLGHL